MRIQIIAELDEDVTEVGAKEAMEEARVAIEEIPDVVSVDVQLHRFDSGDKEDGRTGQ